MRVIPNTHAPFQGGTELAGSERNQGFTLLELLVTLAVAAILLSYGVPSFIDTVRNGRATANANDLITALSFARSEAVKRGARVTVCASDDAATCGGAWTDGWIVIADGAVTDDAVPVVDEVLRVWPAPSGNPSIVTSGSNGAAASWIRFLARGSARATPPMPVTFDMEVEGCSNEQGRRIELNAVGRTTVDRVAC